MKHAFIYFIFIFCWAPTSMRSQLSEDSLSDQVDSIINQLTVEQKVGQLFMIRAFSREDESHIQFVKDQIDKYHVGGICFFQGSPIKQAELVMSFQRRSELPLFIAMDAEWGLGMRFMDDAISFPKNMTLGAVDDHQLIYRMGKEIGRQLKLVGANINFAPVLDVNNNPENPVINFRSFGEDKINVASKSYALMKGMEASGVMACAKHFPGHGDTATDSHHDLPVIPFNKRRLDSLELFPFKMLIDQGIPSVMVAHLQIPSLESRPNRPSTVSGKIVNDLLRRELGFEGLIFTDAMEMKAVTKHFSNGEADLEAFLAGNDIILLPENIEHAYQRILQAVEDGTVTRERLDKSVRRILIQKLKLNLFDEDSYADINNLTKEINHVDAQIIKSQLYQKAITLVRNESNLIPVKDLKSKNYGSIALGADAATPFQQRVLSYVDSDNYWLSKSSTRKDYAIKKRQLSKKDVVFVSFHNMSRYATREFGIDSMQRAFVKELSQETNVVLVLFGSPYALSFFEEDKHILVAYEEDELAQDMAAQSLFGANDIIGKLPVSAGVSFPAGTGMVIPGIKRLGFAIPESVGLNSDTLRRIHEIVEEMIEQKASPGCQILIAKDGKVVFWKAFGHHTYKKEKPVSPEDLYDLASVTKIMAATLSAMHLEDIGKFDLKESIGTYIQEEDTTNKSNIIYEDILAHVGRLKPWIPFYTPTLAKRPASGPDLTYYRSEPCDSFSLCVTPNLYLRTDYQDSIWRRIFSSPLRDKDSYRYSDLAFYIMDRTIQKISGARVDRYAADHFYKPLGLRKTTFNPLSVFDRSMIAPTEEDDYYRMSTVHGTVHDMGAAMLSGISGHAGLFSNALDLGVLMQMLLNEGHYGGVQYLKPETIDKYTRRHWRSSRRGLGFDMKELNPDRSLNMSYKASRHTYGHLGFTGTAVFGDPEYNIIYVFLSNRTYPTMENNKLGKNNYRPRLQTVVYNALMSD